MVILDTSFGIEFKPQHLILTLLKKSFGKISLADFGIYPVPPEGQKEEREAQSIGLINSFVIKNQINKERVFISIPREKVIARFVRLPIAAKENLQKVMEYEISKYSPFEKDEIYFDFQVLKEEKDWLRLFAVFVKKMELNEYLSFLKKVEIQPISVQIPSVSALNLFLYHQGAQDSKPCVLFDIGETYFEMNLLHGKEDWKESIHLPLSIKDDEARWTNTLKQSGVDIDAFSSAHFYAYGTGASEKMLEGFKKASLMQDIFHPPTNRIFINKELSKPYSIYPSLGLPLGGITGTEINLNLLPLEMRRRIRQIWVPLFMILFGLALFLGLTWGVGVFFQYRNELNRLSSEIKQKKPEAEKVDQLKKQKEIMGKEILEYNKIKLGEIPKTEMLKELTQILPGTVWVWNLKYKGNEIEINGYADSASDLIPLLDKSPLFEKVEFASPVTTEKMMRPDGTVEKERFRIKARIEGKK